MDNELQPYAPHADPATLAFTRLEQEMALLRRAVEHLAAEKAEIVIHDYGKTLAEIARRIGAMAETLAALAAMPALKMTPEAFADRMDMAAAMARHEDHAALVEAKRALAETTRDLRTAIGSAATIDAQRRNRRLWAIGGFAAGCLLWSALPGFAARAMPIGWHLPERIEARTMGEPLLWDAGIRLMHADNPQAWQEIVATTRMQDDNRDALTACQHRATKARMSVQCTIMVRPML
ncbi:DUF6118 family protein [Sphingobium cupriresistens]|uniref:Uncharacterized protein n=1 Tax=Sphingobium cupriresistens TaxID=1132417 RepID=A0A8G2DXK6_9SPHN|nr:DUF6118 family protein [Sphingobium cupriresistens]RYM05604.1 hypothetical protein EWH12_20990 [Sphingobium cupriresistens]